MNRSLTVRLAMLGALYLVQGLPFGIQATALPVLLRRQGTSLEAIGFATALAVPWMAKIVWAPFVDARWSSRLGRRRSWILPCQLGLLVALAAAALVDPARSLGTLLALVFVMNVLAATMDVAVDGLAVDVLAPHELGPGNAAQVVGFKAGMIATGGLLLAAVPDIGWQGLFAVAAAMVAVVLFATLGWREGGASESAPAQVREVVAALRESARRPGVIGMLCFIGTYKLGESAADAMWKPFLIDAGYDEASIGLWVGTYGMIASLVGSIAGGFVARRMSRLGAVALLATLRALPIAGQAVLALAAGPSEEGVIAVTLSEHFFGGALTTAMFAFMMAEVDRRIGGTHFTALAAVEATGKAPAGFLSGVIARQLGYAGVFAFAAIVSVAFLGWIVPMRRAARCNDR